MEEEKRIAGGEGEKNQGRRQTENPFNVVLHFGKPKSKMKKGKF